MSVLRTRLDPRSAEFTENAARMSALWDEVAEQLATVPTIGGQR